MNGGDRQRGATPVVGNLLLVAVVIVIAIALVTLSFAFLEGFGTPTADARFEYEETPAGLEMTPTALGTDAIVRLNGKRINTFEADTAGQSVLLPTAPGDRITVVSRDAEQSVLVDRTVDDRSEIGDFIAYYTFDQRTDATVVDRSGNDNDGTATEDGERPTRGSDSAGAYMAFDENDGSVDMGDLAVKTEEVAVDELTIAFRYRITGSGSGSGTDSIQELMQHRQGGTGSFAWYMETEPDAYPEHALDYNIGWTSSPSAQIVTSDSIPGDEVQTVVGTYDGEEMVLYRDGEKIDTKDLSRDVGLGQLWVAGGSGPNPQYMTGKMYEVRLYYTAFSEDEVTVLSEAMGEGVE